ncbi:MAG: hypothetical protein RML37_11510, partial [Chitinophagales bacterium]|nr:hypothetical protein [Chitinophagales bacterium]
MKTISLYLGILLTLLLPYGSIYAQVGTNYTFSQSLGTYIPLSSPTIIASATATTGAGSLDDV